MRTLLLAGLIGGFLLAHTPARADEWSPRVPLDNSVFPSLAIATATIDQAKLARPSSNYIGDIYGQFGVQMKPDRDNETFSVTISSAKFVRKTIFQGVLPQAGVVYHIFPKIDYDYEALYRVVEPIPEAVSFQVTMDNRDLGTKQQTVQIRSLGDCPYAIKHPDGTLISMRWMFGAYVDENDPSLDKILQVALQRKLVPAFKGYQDGPTGVYQQMFAIWTVLQLQGVKYSTITTPSVTSSTVLSQHIRSVTDSISDTQANCVDGSVLLASLYRKIGLQTFLVTIPGHCYLRVVLDPRTGQDVIIETTVIGNVDLKNGPEAADANQQSSLSFNSFERARSVGLKEYQAAFPHLKAKDRGYYCESLDRARSVGLQPIGMGRLKNVTMDGTAAPVEWLRGLF